MTYHMIANFVDVSLQGQPLSPTAKSNLSLLPHCSGAHSENQGKPLVEEEKSHLSYDNVYLESGCHIASEREGQQHLYQTLGEGTKATHTFVYPLHSLGNTVT